VIETLSAMRSDHATAWVILCVCIASPIIKQGSLTNEVQARGTEDIERLEAEKVPWIETLSWSPRAFLHHNFLSEYETKHIINSAKPFVRL